jgi:hypothetical protein
MEQTPKAETKFCIDCKHYVPYGILYGGRQLYRCYSPEGITATLDVVSGKTFYTEPGFCDINRSYSFKCGPEAKWFVQKPAEPAYVPHVNPPGFWKRLLQKVGL